MQQPTDPEQVYSHALNSWQSSLLQFQKKGRLLGWLRLATVLATAIIAYQLFSISDYAAGTAIVAGIALFLMLVARDADNRQRISHAQRMVQINEDELSVLAHSFQNRFDGAAFLPANHPYAHDLDLFGPASLYQYTNRCYTAQGQKLLAQDMLHPLVASQIQLRHEAVREMAADVAWRQNLQATAQAYPVTLSMQRAIEGWISQPNIHFTAPFWKYVVTIYSAISVGTLLLALTGWMSMGYFSLLFPVYFTVSILLSKKAVRSYQDLEGIIPQTETLQQMVKCIEEKEYHSGAWKQLQDSVKTGNEKAFVQLKALQSILNRFDLRLNTILFLFINSFLLWDVRQMISLNRWRNRNREKAGAWFSMVAMAEVLNTLAALHFNHPAWAVPVISTEHYSLDGSQIGHPLLRPEVRVPSDFQLKGKGRIALVTGSNMAGKSTFLRSLGVNTVLAMMGAPVCAKDWTCSVVQIMSSMRIADNLAENTSTFYAELKKLKSILEAVNRKEPILILLDEILRGTNSLDRHTGSVAFIRQLIREQAVAVIATHDVAIGNLEQEYPQAVTNYHFDVQVAGDELYFDYRLKNGICTSLNASLLMKKIGIEL